MSEETQNPFETLLGIEVRESASTKQGARGKDLVYLPWAKAVEEVCKHFPMTSWEIVEYPEYYNVGEHLVERKVPYQKTNQGYFVQTRVTVCGVTKPMWLPILDNYNKQVDNPTAVQINKTLMRCLVKNFAAHGLGIKLYMKEDSAPEDEAPKQTKPAVSASDVEKQILTKELVKLVNGQNKGFNGVTRYIKETYKKDKSTDLDIKQLTELINVIKEGKLPE